MTNDEKKAKIADLITKFRDEQFISQESLADSFNYVITEKLKIDSKISKSTISQWERQVFMPDKIMIAAIAATADQGTPIKKLADDLRSTLNGLTWQE